MPFSPIKCWNQCIRLDPCVSHHRIKYNLFYLLSLILPTIRTRQELPKRHCRLWRRLWQAGGQGQLFEKIINKKPSIRSRSTFTRKEKQYDGCGRMVEDENEIPFLLQQRYSLKSISRYIGITGFDLEEFHKVLLQKSVAV